jgi:hypothetical protein
MKTKTTLLGLGLSGAVFSLLVGLVGAWGLHTLSKGMDNTAVVMRATQSASDLDMMHDAIRSDVNSALLAAKNGNTPSALAAQADALAHANALKGHLADVLAQPLKPALLDQTQALRPLIEGYAAQAQNVAQKAVANPQGAEIGLEQFQEIFDALETKLVALSDAIATESAHHARLEARNRTLAQQSLMGVALVSALVLVAIAILVPRHLKQPLKLPQVSEPPHLQTLMQDMADNAQKANRLAQDALDDATQGGDMVIQVMDTMNNITEATHKILDLIQVIDANALQTQLLALNAVAQAERVGDQDHGLDMVVSEIRNLASHSGKAAKEISYLVSANLSQVQRASTLAKLAGFSMTNVEGSISQVRSMVGQISTAPFKPQSQTTPAPVYRLSEPKPVRNIPIGLPALT